MQVALSFAFAPSPFSTARLMPNRALALPWKSRPKLRSLPRSSVIATSAAHDTSTVDYSSVTSVFPAEACETIGGEACDVQMYPEVKLKPEGRSTTTRTTSELVDREYLEYNSPKTVFVEEACDDLGGEFCEPEFWKEV